MEIDCGSAAQGPRQDQKAGERAVKKNARAVALDRAKSGFAATSSVTVEV
ncbi:MAG TPA: hypothetical protein VNI78_01295 [Vicinamibacterales bacterium]|nr:hypothetical protein [Vicinamibacterales bacterium]